jgi:hypothetical protein
MRIALALLLAGCVTTEVASAPRSSRRRDNGCVANCRRTREACVFSESIGSTASAGFANIGPGKYESRPADNSGVELCRERYADCRDDCR